MSCSRWNLMMMITATLLLSSVQALHGHRRFKPTPPHQSTDCQNIASRAQELALHGHRRLAHSGIQPRRRNLRSQGIFQLSMFKEMFLVYFTLNRLVGKFVWLIKNQLKKVSHNRDKSVQWLPGFLWKILSSAFFADLASFFDRYTKNSANQIKSKIEQAYFVVLLLDHLGGARFIRNAYDFMQDMPLVRRVANSMTYRRYIRPAVKETKDNFKYIKSKIDGTYVQGKEVVDFHGHDSEDVENYLKSYLPDTVLSVLTRQQMADIILRATKDGTKGLELPADDTPRVDSLDDDVSRDDGPFSASSEEEEDMTGTRPFEDSESEDQFSSDSEFSQSPEDPRGPVNDSSDDDVAESAGSESSSEENIDDIASSEY